MNKNYLIKSVKSLLFDTDKEWEKNKMALSHNDKIQLISELKRRLEVLS